MKESRIVTIWKWNFDLLIVPIYRGSHSFLFSFGFYKMLKRPDEGSCITEIGKKDYKGFWFRKGFNIGGFGISI